MRVAGNFSIRGMSLQDLLRVAQIDQEVFACPWTKREFRKTWIKAEAVAAEVCCERGTVVGYILTEIQEHASEILRVGVDYTMHRHRIGTLLLDSAMETAARQGRGLVFAHVPDTNTDAHCWLRFNGFKCSQVKRDFYKGPTPEDNRDAYLMEHPLQ